jgi:hypothetical protein
MKVIGALTLRHMTLKMIKKLRDKKQRENQAEMIKKHEKIKNR